ncbi:pyruvate dehydrogenase (acetyl-transferring), homodimeric type [Humibacillus sp. DSM 29435]|uniref:pyruvate dehydrogenase (acetyl-transferring), homodimeric type n=1 Tax=Humibacillus sp. DSM 29435 TaxID=1869167 RepID=UPI0008729BF9|nr:pyruvate dehydrogenase (acetyl-transferring), homodimeric type [Humibacillus sp. DSM 29435]OFE18722.1 pyruvate dehydrogenase (acetyl-transferring), homodimeric type [Humibacillus sp. DSM 29435]
MTAETNKNHSPAHIDREELGEWSESFDQLVRERGVKGASAVLRMLGERAAVSGIDGAEPVTTDYVNTIPADQEPDFPGDEDLERKYRRLLRWNAAVLVHRAQRPDISVGGHISTYAGASTLYEVGLNHFFRGPDHPGGGDQVFFQGHASPGMYARAYLEGRLSEEDLDGFRQEKSKAPHALPSYPHPRMMPDFWQFPTVSMGIGPMNAIYQAQLNRYLTGRGIKDTSDQHVWAFLGDGEMDEPESRGLLQLAANDKLDNLTFVINCNLQRLDGPVRGNGKIVQELEGFFRGAGWNVVKVLWGREWDTLLEKDAGRDLVRVMNETVDGDYQTYKGESGAYIREHFFGRTDATAKLVEDLTDDQIWNLKRGGHDYNKVYAAYHAATAGNTTGRPTVVLAKTVKGYGLGANFEARNATHQMKKLTAADLKAFRDLLHIPISDEQIDADPYNVPYYKPADDSPEIQYLQERRRVLGGYVPSRRTTGTEVTVPDVSAFATSRKGSGKQMAATTMAFVRVLRDLMRDKGVGHRVVPIIPDEARTFGMDSFFPTAKIYNPAGQNYEAVDRALFLKYTESTKGQILHTGINEAGSFAAFTAVGTSYATHGEPLIPVYVFYSMFGFQRTGDAMWAAMDQMARGFIIGATAGRTTLTGEGLQHADGHSPILAATNPAMKIYDPAYGYEIAHIVAAGLEQMYGPGSSSKPESNVMYYITVYNEPMLQPAEPDDADIDGIIRGLHRVATGSGDGPQCQLMGSGVSVPWALEAAKLLASDWGVSADVWSVTSWAELRRDGLAAEEHNFLHADGERRTAYVTEKLKDAVGPVVASTDFASEVPDQIRQFVPNAFATLGADGHGFSDTRAAARRFFHIDVHSMVVRALQLLADDGKVDASVAREAAERYRLLDVNAGTTGTAGGDS